MDLENLKRRARPLYAPVFERSATARILALLAKPKGYRNTEYVTSGYANRWDQYMAYLDRCQTLESWLWIRGHDDVPTTSLVNGRVRHGSDWMSVHYYVEAIANALTTAFPGAKSLTEYGCGIGRPLLALKQRLPWLKCYGYELTEEGVRVARAAANKFDLNVEFAQLDYIKDPEEKYVHPKTDVALTIFSLEQVPHASPVAVKNMLDHVEMGSIHLEPVPENYPLTYLGVLGRVFSRRVDYLQNFDRAVRALPVRDVQVRTLDSSHNPLIPAPSLYTLAK